MEYKLIRSKRKSIGIKISLEKGIEVRAPLKASERSINKVIMDNKLWIAETWEKLLKEERGKKVIKYEEGNKLFLFGKLLPIEIRVGSNNKLNCERDKFIFTLVEEIIRDQKTKEIICRDLFENFLRNTAKTYLIDRTIALAKMYNFTVNNIRIKKVKTRWGSCSSKNNINLNLKLIMADKKAIDYVIIHELCHTKELNHSKRFWTLVEDLIPDYKEQQKYLKEVNSYFNVLD
ncbi:hypothetical protein SAMN02745163_03142 [Clostridium cavendishii DSM 21758]|uniref:YgjP-like metallopeptidase domain-containing protein n=1 Tax=Clostridium cavendishii DSM 21758 TaxID=1121302 RepID=A0A1M6PFZ3_9CLOT|nr:SprT family zinc-dependent metalloprotease [Clostridium cavendishii]SHK06807.1 hypothetical protein SAMN02745163_03142 [Clostridium cavendishii DSM 21758]